MRASVYRYRQRDQVKNWVILQECINLPGISPLTLNRGTSTWPRLSVMEGSTVCWAWKWKSSQATVYTVILATTVKAYLHREGCNQHNQTVGRHGGIVFLLEYSQMCGSWDWASLDNTAKGQRVIVVVIFSHHFHLTCTQWAPPCRCHQTPAPGWGTGVRSEWPPSRTGRWWRRVKSKQAEPTEECCRYRPGRGWRWRGKTQEHTQFLESRETNYSVIMTVFITYRSGQSCMSIYTCALVCLHCWGCWGVWQLDFPL